MKVVDNSIFHKSSVDAPSVNGSGTIHHKPKFVVFLCEHKGNFAHCVDRFLHVCEPHACQLHFLCFFSIRTDQCLLSAHRNYDSPHVQGKLIYCALSVNCMQNHTVWSVCAKLYILCPHTCFFTFVKGMCHSPSSNASDTSVAACLIGVVFTFIKGMRHSASGYTIDVHIRAFLCSSKA